MKKKVFVSVPMNGRDDEDVKKERALLMEKYAPEYELIDQMVGPVTTRVDMFGRSIRLMSKADLVVFSKDWNGSNGCKVEKYICDLYGIPTIEEGMD